MRIFTRGMPNEAHLSLIDVQPAFHPALRFFPDSQPFADALVFQNKTFPELSLGDFQSSSFADDILGRQTTRARTTFWDDTLGRQFQTTF